MGKVSKDPDYCEIMDKIVDSILPKGVGAFWEPEVREFFRLKGLPHSDDTFRRWRQDKGIRHTKLRYARDSHEILYTRTDLTCLIKWLFNCDLIQNADMQKWSITQAELCYIAERDAQLFHQDPHKWLAGFYYRVTKAIEEDYANLFEMVGVTDKRVKWTWAMSVLLRLISKNSMKRLKALYKRGLQIPAQDAAFEQSQILHGPPATSAGAEEMERLRSFLTLYVEKSDSNAGNLTEEYPERSSGIH